MLDHVTIRAVDPQASERFYRTTLGALGIEPTRATAGRVEWDDFVVASADAANPPTRDLHVAFVAPSRDHVEEFWHAGTASGSPGARPSFPPAFTASVLDPDGTKVESVFRESARHE
jgi:catechol 2,3-dioxygenase-like lactoylglutathione lyase family enzyme